MRYSVAVVVLVASIGSAPGQGGREVKVEVGHRVDVKLGETFGFHGRRSDLPGSFKSEGFAAGADVGLDTLLVEDEDDLVRVARLTGAFDVKRGPAQVGGQVGLVRAVARKDRSVTFVLSARKRFAPETAKITLEPEFVRAIGGVTGGDGSKRFIEDYGYGAVTSVTPAAGVHLVYRLQFHTESDYKESAAEVRAKVSGFGRGSAAWSETVAKHGKRFRVELNVVQMGANLDKNILDTLNERVKLGTVDPDVLLPVALEALRPVTRDDAAVVAYTVRPWTLIDPRAFGGNDALRAAVNKSPALAPRFESELLRIALRRADLEEQKDVARTLGLPTGPAERALQELTRAEEALSPFEPDARLSAAPRLNVPREKVVGEVRWRLTEQLGGDPDARGFRHYRVNCMPTFTLPNAEVVEWVAVSYDGLPLFDTSKDSPLIKFYGISHPHPGKELPPQSASQVVALDRVRDGSPLADKRGPVDVSLDAPFNWLVQIEPTAFGTATVSTWEAVREGMQGVRGKLLVKVRGSEQLVEVELPRVPGDITVQAR